MRNTAAVLLSGAIILSVQTVAFAANDTSFDANLKNCEVIFEQRGTAPMFLFETAKQNTTNTIKLSTKKYTVEIQGKDIGELNKKLERYDLSVVKRTEDIKEYDDYFGDKTPKNVFEIAKTTPEIPGKMKITMHNGSFRPNAIVNIYKHTDKNKYETVKENVTVDVNGDYSFEVTSGGEYVVVNRRVSDDYPGYDFDRPQRNDISALTTLTQGGETFMRDVTSLQEYLKNKVVDEDEELYFDDLWKIR